MAPIDLYAWPTPNGFKISIALEELDLPYRIVPIDIYAEAQFTPEFLAISPNNKIPAIVDPDGPRGVPVALFESGAILFYLAMKSGRLLPVDPADHHETMQWLMFQVGGLGPMLGQAHHFRGSAPEQVPYAIARYTNEAARLYGVLDRRLALARYLAGQRYSIADVATFPWIRSHQKQGQDLADFPNVARWFAEISRRAAVQRGLASLNENQTR